MNQGLGLPPPTLLSERAHGAREEWMHYDWTIKLDPDTAVALVPPRPRAKKPSPLLLFWASGFRS